MAEERTVSAFTKINSADHANQIASTIVNITKVKQHLHRSATKVHLSALFHFVTPAIRLHQHPRPIVRFRDLSKYVKDGSAGTSNELHAEQAAIKHTPGPTSSLSTLCTQPNTPEALADVDTEGLDEENELDERLWEDSDSEDDESDCKQLAAAHAAASTDRMDIEGCEGVNVQVPDLLDLLSDAPVSGSSSMISTEAPSKVTKNLKGKTSQGPRVFDVSGIHF
jgi:hypothetical protein